MSLDEVVEKEIKSNFKEHRIKNYIKIGATTAFFGYIGYLMKSIYDVGTDNNAGLGEVLTKGGGAFIQMLILTRVGIFAYKLNEKIKKQKNKKVSEKILYENIYRAKKNNTTTLIATKDIFSLLN
jgi:hypothetical protein